MRTRAAHIFDRDRHDWYLEETWCSERLFETENFGVTILDPCCGSGRIISAARRAGLKAIGSDIVERGAPEPFRLLNILHIQTSEVYKWWRQADSIVTNPPFNDIVDVAQRCVALTRYRVALICPVRRLPAARSWLQDIGLIKILLMTPRPSMPTGEYIRNGGKVGGGTTDFAWIIMEKGFTGKPTIGWLCRDKNDDAGTS